MRRHTVFLILLACACALACAFNASAEGPPAPKPVDDSKDPPLMPQAQFLRLLDRYRHRTWHWQRVIGRPLTLKLRHVPQEQHAHIAAWRRIAERTKQIAHHPPHLRAWSCIHRYEGSWQDPNPPYYGGLQMDITFQRTYGRRLLARKGTADNWTPLEQMWVAERAFRAGRGFYPWPNTARYCGLL